MKAETADRRVRTCEPQAHALPGGAVVMRPEDEGHRRRFGAHVHLFRQGDDATRIYELIDGEVMLYKLLPDGRRQVVELIGPGDVFGVSAVPVYECSAETLLPGAAIVHDRAFVDHSPELFRFLSARLQAQFCAMHEHAMLLGRKSALERVASFVMKCVPGRGGYGCCPPQQDDCNSITVRIGLTRQEIADYLGLTIETVSRAFSELRRRGVVTIDRQDEVFVNDICGICKLTGAH